MKQNTTLFLVNVVICKLILYCHIYIYAPLFNFCEPAWPKQIGIYERNKNTSCIHKVNWFSINRLSAVNKIVIQDNLYKTVGDKNTTTIMIVSFSFSPFNISLESP